MQYTLITGASSGIGESLAGHFATGGHNLVLVARSEQKLQQLAKQLMAEYSVQVLVEPADLSKRAAARKLAVQGEKFLADARAADAAGDSTKAGGLRKQAHTAYDQAFTNTALWEMEIEEAYSNKDRQVEQIKKERSRWMTRIIALHKTTGR